MRYSQNRANLTASDGSLAGDSAASGSCHDRVMSSSALPTPCPSSPLSSSAPSPLPALATKTMAPLTSKRSRKRGRCTPLWLITALWACCIRGTRAKTTFEIIALPYPSQNPSHSPTPVPTGESSSESTPSDANNNNPQPHVEEPTRTSWTSSSATSPPRNATTNSLVFGTQAGYDQPGGQEAMCWKTTFDSHQSLQRTELLPNCGEDQVLQVFLPDLEGEERLGIRESYDYQVQLDLDLAQFGIPNELRLISPQQPAPSLALQILFCRVGQVSFCSPFVPEQVLALDDSHSTSLQQRPYFESDWWYLPVPDNATTIHETISVPTVVDQVGSYFVLATLRFVTADPNSHEVPPQPHYRWDMANGLPWEQGRVVQYWEPPEIMEVSQGARITSYVAVGIASCVLLGLIYQTILHRKNQVLHLSQVGFLILFLVAALVATVSTVLLEPKNDLYCQLSSPMTLIPLQLMYSITIGRLWRINAVISPLLVEHFRKNLKSQRWTGKLVSWVHRKTGGNGSSKRNVQLRRTVTSSRLAFVISMFAIPQVILQICALVVQPQERVIEFDDWTQGMALCQSTNVDHPLGNILYYCYAALILLLFVLLIMAYSCRNLPSLFNETHVIYTIIFRTFVFVVFGVVLVVVLQTQQNSVIAPDITYLLWLTVILYTTLASSLGLLVPKLRMIWKGEVVIVSKLVSDHHRARREKEAEARSKHNGLENVTGLDLSASGSHTNDSYLNGSFNTEAYFNGSLTGSLTSSFTNQSLTNGDAPQMDQILSEDPKKPKLSDVRERSAASTCSLPVTSASESSNSWMPITSEDVLDDEDDMDEDNPFDADLANTNVPSMGEWKSRMKSFRDKWNSRSTSFVVHNTSPPQPPSRPTSELLPNTSTATDDLNEDPEDNVVTTDSSNAVDFTRERSVTRRRKEERFKRQRSRRRRSTLMVVSPEETPPRRLVMKMVDQQDCLSAITTKIMSGLSVRPEEWDKLVRLHNILEKCLQEEVSFTWKVQQPRQRSTKQLAPDLDRAASTKSLHLEDLANPGGGKASKSHQDDDDHHSAGGNSRDATLRRSNTLHSATYKSFAKLSHVAKEFRRVVDCRDRKYGLSTYKQCFIGSDAIDSLIYAGIVESREDGVVLGRRLAEELHLFKHVTGDHDFKDEHLFYEYYSDSDSDCSSFHGEDDNASIQLFDIDETSAHAEARAFREAVDVRDRRYHLKLYPKVFVGCEAVDALIYHGVAKTRWEAVQLGRRLARETRLFRHVCGDHELRDEWLFYRFSELDEHGVESSLGSALSDSRPRSAIAELADAFEMYVDIRDRWYHAKKYRSCFIGSEAVDAMIYAGLVTTREEGVALGRRLEKELRLFHHACFDHEFKDEYLFYQLRRRGNKLGGSSRGGKSDLDESGSSNHDQLGLSRSSSSQGEKHTKFSNLMDKAAAFRQCAVITTGTWRLKKYPNVFIGCDTVDRMVYTGLAQNRMEAVQLGRALAREMKMFRHVANDHAFSDSYLFYRFRSEDDSSSAGSYSNFSKNSGNVVSPPTHVQTAGGEMSESQSLSQSNNNSFSSSMTGRSALAEKAEVFRSFAKVKDRKYRLSTYKSCFVGEQVVDALVQAGVVETREAAVEYGNELQSQLRLFQHVVGAHSFKDEYLFYRFRDLGFKDSVDVLGTSLNSANEMSVSSTIGGDYTRSELENDVVDVMGGPASTKFGLPILDENSELDAADHPLHTRTSDSNKVDLGNSFELPPLIEYDDVDAGEGTEEAVVGESHGNDASLDHANADATSQDGLDRDEEGSAEAVSLQLSQTSETGKDYDKDNAQGATAELGDNLV